MSRPIHIIAILCLVFPLLTEAQDTRAPRDRENMVNRGELVQPPQRDAAPLLYALPELGTAGAQELEIRIIQAKYWLVREIVALPAGTADGAVIDVLYTHPAELNRMREIESTTPGSLRFLAMIGERVLTDEPFAEIEARGTMLTVDSAVGEIRTIEGRKSPRLRLGAQSKDPVCAEYCDAQLASCLDWADPRGSDANLCYSWHWSCWSQCGDIPDPCVEPKSTSTYTTNTLVSTSIVGSLCAKPSFPPNATNKYYNQQYRTYRIDTYTRTTHCDDSYTDTLTGTTYGNILCWVPTIYSCGPTYNGPPSPSCPLY